MIVDSPASPVAAQSVHAQDEDALLRWLLPLRSSRVTFDDLSDRSVDWPATISAAARDFALPMLATAVVRANAIARLPSDAATYLDYSRVANAAANSAIRDQCLAIGTALAARGITAVLLKGAIWLFEDGPGRADRMMRDIDILVPEGQREIAESILVETIGYRPAEWIQVIDGRNHHGHPLGHPDGAVTVEIHDALNSLPDHLAAHEVIGGASGVAPGLAIPSLAHRVLHHVIASQVINADLATGTLGLREATDLGRMIERGQNSLDWDRLAAVARQRGFYAALAAAVYKACHVTARPVPATFASDRAAQRHLARCLLQRRWPVLDRVLRSIGLFRRAVAWHRDAFALELTDRRDLAAHLAVNRRRIGRAVARLGSLRHW